MATSATAWEEIIPGWTIGDSPGTERLDRDLLARAYKFSEEAHRGQTRTSGDPYITHCVEVAQILAELQLDSLTVACGLIHDVVEDTRVSVADVEKEFG
nr:bifunctional (p)ppGpp synthetase/guanosine-3',5'-bis(diphosphate) 3'-pyrophosphohydrolase [Gemmatimonadaceae bacterium]